MTQRLVSVVLALGAVAGLAAADDRNGAAGSVVRVVTYSQRANWSSPWEMHPVTPSSGSGFVVAGGLVMTNAHVVSDAKLVMMFLHNDPNPHEAEVHQIAHDSDLALLRPKESGVLEGIAGRPLEPARLAAAVRESNRARASWREANRLRREHPPVAYGSASLRLTGGPLLQKLGLPETAVALADYAGELRERIDARAFLPLRRRLLWLHLYPLYDGRFMRSVEEELGMVSVFEESSDVWWDELDPANPFPGFARRILGCPFAGPVARRAAAVLRLARDYRADGVVHFSHRGCKVLTGGFPFVAQALRAAGIPVLELSGDCADNRSPATAPWRARLEAFAEMLG